MGQAKRRRELGLMPDQLSAAVKDIPPIPDNLADGYFRLREELYQPGGELPDKLSAVYAYLEKYDEFVATFAARDRMKRRSERKSDWGMFFLSMGRSLRKPAVNNAGVSFSLQRRSIS